MLRGFIGTTSPFKGRGFVSDVLLMGALFVLLLSLGALLHDIWTTEQLQRSPVYVPTAHGTLHLSCLDVADASAAKWALNDLSPTPSIVSRAQALEGPDTYVKACTVVGIGMSQADLESIQNINR